MLDAHDPYPGVVIDRTWNILLANDAAGAFTVQLPESVLSPAPNVFRLCLHPDGLATRTVNFDEWAGYLVRQLRRTILLTGDAALADIESEVLGYPNVARVVRRVAAATADEQPILVPLVLAAGDATLSFFTTLTTFGTPLDVTLDELAVELFFPSDEFTDRALRAPSDPR
jgi:hypothetical protein